MLAERTVLFYHPADARPPSLYPTAPSNSHILLLHKTSPIPEWVRPLNLLPPQFYYYIPPLFFPTSLYLVPKDTFKTKTKTLPLLV